MKNSTNQTESPHGIFQRIIESADKDFEHKILYISSGALLLSLTFIEKITKDTVCQFYTLLIIGWLFLIFTLIVNLHSQLQTIRFLQSCQEDLNNGIDENKINEKAKIQNDKHNRTNKLLLFSLAFGIFFIILFCSVNAGANSNSVKKETTCNN